MARSRIPTPEEHARLWGKLDFKERRRILKSVNKGNGLETRKDARVGIGVARQQQRYWKLAWLFGPAIGVVRIPDWTQVAITAFLGAMLLGALSVYRYRNAVQAEKANLARIGIT